MPHGSELTCCHTLLVNCIRSLCLLPFPRVKQCCIEETCAKPFLILGRFGNVFQSHESWHQLWWSPFWVEISQLFLCQRFQFFPTLLALLSHTDDSGPAEMKCVATGSFTQISPSQMDDVPDHLTLFVALSAISSYSSVKTSLSLPIFTAAGLAYEPTS